MSVLGVFNWIFEIVLLLSWCGILVSLLSVFGLTVALAVAAVLYAVKKSDGCKKALKAILKVMAGFLALGFMCTWFYLISELMW